MRASDYRAAARASLKGFWGMSIGVVVVAGLIAGAVSWLVSAITSLFSTGWFSILTRQIVYGGGLDLEDMIDLFGGLFGGAFILGIAASVAVTAALGVLVLGQNQYFINLVSRRDYPAFDDLFSKVRLFGKAFLLQLLISVFTSLWSLLFIVPGIIASYRYSMAPYLLTQNPALSPLEAIRASKEMMAGRKGRLFCLDISFLGWAVLAGISCGIGWLWLTPYCSAARAAFYLELTGQLPQGAPAYPQQPGASYGPAGYGPAPYGAPQGAPAYPQQPGAGYGPAVYGAPQAGAPAAYPPAYGPQQAYPPQEGAGYAGQTETGYTPASGAQQEAQPPAYPQQPGAGYAGQAESGYSPAGYTTAGSAPAGDASQGTPAEAPAYSQQPAYAPQNYPQQETPPRPPAYPQAGAGYAGQAQAGYTPAGDAAAGSAPAGYAPQGTSAYAPAAGPPAYPAQQDAQPFAASAQPPQAPDVPEDTHG